VTSQELSSGVLRRLSRLKESLQKRGGPEEGERGGPEEDREEDQRRIERRTRGGIKRSR